MIYYKYQDDYSPIDGGITYVETEKGVAYRQITVNGDKYLMSNLNYPETGMILAEGEINPKIDDVEEITKIEFEDVWATHLINYQAQWKDTKQRNNIGSEVTGYIQLFYPQGVIVNLGENSLGIANYSECESSAKPEWMYPGYKVTAIIAGYDELNQWLVLEKPKVYNEVLKNHWVNL
jgi:hypothetical protein